MIRIAVAAATLVVFIVIGITIWFQSSGSSRKGPTGANEPPRRYDTSGGQEMRPRWDGAGR